MSWLKHVAEAALANGGPATVARLLRRRQALILAFHNIVPDGERAGADTSLHLARSDFARQLDLLARSHDVVPLEQLLAPHPDAARGAKPWACLTFDDAYAGAVTAGLEETGERGLPVTVFVAPGLLGGRSFWWDECVPVGRNSRILREHALETLRGDGQRIRSSALEAGSALAPVPACARSATLDDLQNAARSGLVKFGAHSWSHRNLARLHATELDEELERPLEWLRTHFGASESISCLAYPYGLSSPGVETASEMAGYSAALRIDGGLARVPLQSRYAAPRVNVPAGLSDRGLVLRLSGLI